MARQKAAASLGKASGHFSNWANNVQDGGRMIADGASLTASAARNGNVGAALGNAGRTGMMTVAGGVGATFGVIEPVVKAAGELGIGAAHGVQAGYYGMRAQRKKEGGRQQSGGNQQSLSSSRKLD